MSERNKTYKGFRLKAPARAFGVKRLKNGQFAAFTVDPNGDMHRGEVRDSWEEAESDIYQASILSEPARIYAQPSIHHRLPLLRLIDSDGGSQAKDGA